MIVVKENSRENRIGTCMPSRKSDEQKRTRITGKRERPQKDVGGENDEKRIEDDYGKVEQKREREGQKRDNKRGTRTAARRFRRLWDGRNCTEPDLVGSTSILTALSVSSCWCREEKWVFG